MMKEGVGGGGHMQGKGRGEKKMSVGGQPARRHNKQSHVRESSNHRQPRGHAPWMDRTNQRRPPPDHSTWGGPLDGRGADTDYGCSQLTANSYRCSSGVHQENLWRSSGEPLEKLWRSSGEALNAALLRKEDLLKINLYQMNEERTNRTNHVILTGGILEEILLVLSHQRDLLAH